MAANDRRSRSNTSISTKSHRPLSRASTASVQSFPEHDLQPQFQHHPPQQPLYPQQGYNNSFALIQQAAQHVNQQENVQMDPVHQLISYNADVPAGQPLQHIDPNTHSHTFQAAVPQQSSYIASQVEVEEKKKKSGGSGNATNDKELREMLTRNEGRQLKDVAAEVIATDRTSKAEKSKQLFAMLWLKAVCKTASASVPRNKVYSKYAERCGTERVIPLNPASFGKLVRVIFPGIQTRRLGVRGESKYHYVDLALIDDEDDKKPQQATGSLSRHELKRQGSTSSKIDFNSIPRLPADTAAFPPQEHSFDTSNTYFSNGSSKGRLFTDLYSSQFRPPNARTSSAYEFELKFPSPDLLAAADSLDIELPDIVPYLPNRTDPDAAENLVALYRTHCTSLVDAVRYCKEKQFFRLYGSFHGTLTVPVQKLFAMPELAPWIRECDWMMYQKMIRNVSQLTLQVAPAPVLKFLDNVAKTLHTHIGKVFHALPTHVLEAKLEPASLFARLLRQMLRVNSTAHAAAVMLTVDDNRDRMWADWQSYVNIKRVIENTLSQSCNHEAVWNILTTEIRGMFLPLKSEMWLPDGTFYQVSNPDPPIDPMQETVIDRIAAFLTKLPSRFPQVPASQILWCINAIGSAALREITVENGPSFQGWWLTKVFIDEMALWLASLGGFLSHSHTWNSLSYSPDLMGESINTGMTNAGSGSNNDSRFSSMDADFGPNQSFMISGGNDAMPEGLNTNQEINTRRHPERHDQVTFNLDIDFASTQPEDPTLDDSGIVLDDGIDAKFATNMHHTLRTHLTQLPTGSA